MSVDTHQTKRRRTASPEPDASQKDGNELISVVPDNAPVPGEASAEIPDEEHAAPPSSAAGAHAKPLSALFESSPVAAASKGSVAKGKGKLKEKGGDNAGEQEGFEAMLGRLQDGGKARASRGSWIHEGVILTREDALAIRPYTTNIRVDMLLAINTLSASIDFTTCTSTTSRLTETLLTYVLERSFGCFRQTDLGSSKTRESRYCSRFDW